MKKHSFDAVIFDMDGVITYTAHLHAKAWKTIFDEYLLLRQEKYKEPFKPFDIKKDYLKYVDGKPRYDGIKSFFKSRGIFVPLGKKSDSPNKETVYGLGSKKNAVFNDLLKKGGVKTFPTSIDLIKKLKKAGVKVGLVSASKNCPHIIESVGIEKLFDTRVDGIITENLRLKGKPSGQTFVKAASNLNTVPARAVVIEDANSGVQAGRRGSFGLVIGVARHKNEKELLENGADITVTDLKDINIQWLDQWFQKKPKPLFKYWGQKKSPKKLIRRKGITENPHYSQPPKSILFSKKELIIFLDYDGTLTPIVERPELAILSEDMKRSLAGLSKKYKTAIVSGRMRKDVEKLVGIKGIFYAGSHGFDIKGPGFAMIHPKVKALIPAVVDITGELSNELGAIDGVIIEHKKFSVAVHYRLVANKHLPKIKRLVDKIVRENPSFRLMHGKKVFEILPAIDWHKGKALMWIMKTFNLSWKDTMVVYIGDDTTDENAFRIIRHNGMGIMVSKRPEPSTALFRVDSPKEVKKLFDLIIF